LGTKQEWERVVGGVGGMEMLGATGKLESVSEDSGRWGRVWVRALAAWIVSEHEWFPRFGNRNMPRVGVRGWRIQRKS